MVLSLTVGELVLPEGDLVIMATTPMVKQAATTQATPTGVVRPDDHAMSCFQGRSSELEEIDCCITAGTGIASPTIPL